MFRQIQVHSQRPTIRGHLAQTMNLLGLTVEELQSRLDNALANNPALEMIAPARCPSCGRASTAPGICPPCRSQGSASDEPIVFTAPYDEFRLSFTGENTREGDRPAEEWQAASGEDLPTCVLKQIAPELAPADRAIAAHLLTSLDEDGLLTADLLELAMYFHVPPSRIETVLALIQHADPLGVGARSPQEALKIQLQALHEQNIAVPVLAAELVEMGLELLARKNLVDLANRLESTPQAVNEALNFISANLNPYPARAHWSGESTPATFQRPDIFIHPLDTTPDSPLVVEIAQALSGTLRVNPLFRQALKEAPNEKLESWSSDLEEARLLVKCLQQREQALVRMMRVLAIRQREFILRGESALIPLTRAALATELDVHESTISRAVAGKVVELPNGHLVPLSRFFDRSLNVRSALRDLVANETRPLRDEELARLLSERGFEIARRTVVKYRSMEGILPASMRKVRQAW